MQKSAKITSKGQVTIPQEIRHALGLKRGDTLIFETDGSGACIRPEDATDVFERFAGAWLEEGEEGVSIADINRQVREMRGHDE